MAFCIFWHFYTNLNIVNLINIFNCHRRLIPNRKCINSLLYTFVFIERRSQRICKEILNNADILLDTNENISKFTVTNVIKIAFVMVMGHNVVYM